MSDSAASAPAPAVAGPSTSTATPKKPVAAKKTAAKRPLNKSGHPPTATMVNAALATLKEKKGSSLQAIKKYIVATYLVDGEKQAPFIKKYLKSAIDNKTIVQTKGSGASGRFKLASEGDKPKKAAASPKKKAAPKKPKEAGAKKAAASPKKKPAAAKPKAPAKPKAAAAKPKAAPKPKAEPKPKAAPKAKKTGKSPAAKKSPKPKKPAAPKTPKAAA